MPAHQIRRGRFGFPLGSDGRLLGQRHHLDSVMACEAHRILQDFKMPFARKNIPSAGRDFQPGTSLGTLHLVPELTFVP
jgi:hypothetical protein